MTKRQEDKLNMFDSVLTHHGHNKQATETMPALQNAYTALSAVVAAINSTVQQQMSSIKGHTVAKVDNKEALSDFGNQVAGALYAWAVDNNDPVLKEKVKTSYRLLLGMRDEELANLCRVYYELAVTQNSLADYGLTKEVTDAFKLAIDTYQTSVPAPRNAMVKRQSHGAKLASLFKEADTILKDKIDKLSLRLKKTNPDFVEIYQFNRRIVNSGTNATGLRMVVKDAKTGKAVAGATIHIEALQLTVVTDKEGEAVVRPVAKGTHTIMVEKEGYQAQTIAEQKATVGKTTVVEVLLKQ